jgi:hypothetical protein
VHLLGPSDRVGDVVVGVGAQEVGERSPGAGHLEPPLERVDRATGAHPLPPPHELPQGERASERRRFTHDDLTHVRSLHGHEQARATDDLGVELVAAVVAEVEPERSRSRPGLDGRRAGIVAGAHRRDRDRRHAGVEEHRGERRATLVRGADEEDVDVAIAQLPTPGQSAKSRPVTRW